MPMKMYRFGAGSTTKARLLWLNEPRIADRYGDLRLPRGPRHTPIPQIHVGSGFPVEMDEPIVVIDKRFDRSPLPDADPLGDRGTLLFSDRLKTVVQGVDPTAFEFVQAETRILTSEGESEGPRYWACDLVQFVDALDLEKSHAEFVEHDEYTIVGPHAAHRAIFKQSLVGDRHIFRIALDPFYIVCDDFLRRTLIDAGFKKCLGFRLMGEIDAG
jgi:Protein of unknown function (DUF1629)